MTLQFAPQNGFNIAYFTKDGENEGSMTMNFTPLSGELSIAGLESESGNEAIQGYQLGNLIQLRHHRVFMSPEETSLTNAEGTQEDGSIYFAGLTVGLKITMLTSLVASTSSQNDVQQPCSV
ncbi:hypothetical protein OH492_05455 [Vibrio chagasii]|nr:hypothetical protein [Vibrio chagasii]